MPKIVKILRGLPGSGKTTYANHLAGALVVSSDHFFAADGVYRFDPRVLSFAHSHCRVAFIQALKAGCPLVVVDNTNIKVEHFREYLEKAREAGYAVEIHEFEIEPSHSHMRNVHSVPRDAIYRMADQWEPVPDHWRELVMAPKGAA